MGHFTQIRAQQISSLYSQNPQSWGVERHWFERHSFDIANAPKKQVKASLKTTYGINIQSPFCVLPTVDVTKQFPKVLFNVKHV